MDEYNNNGNYNAAGEPGYDQQYMDTPPGAEGSFAADGTTGSDWGYTNDPGMGSQGIDIPVRNNSYEEAAGYNEASPKAPQANEAIEGVPPLGEAYVSFPPSSAGPADMVQSFAESTENTLNALGGEPTPAEIEDMKREKAARRRKKMLREKRMRERRRQAIIRCALLIAAAILVIVIIVKIFTGIGVLIKNASKNHRKATEVTTTEATTTEEPVAQIDEAIIAKELPESREDALNMLKAQAETNSDIKNIVENEAVYPDIVLQHLAINSELIDFTLFYPAQISIPFNGDFTIDADTSQIPLFLQYDSQWAYADYGQTVLGLNGAAPTCLSMAYVYLTGDGSKNPIIIGDFSMEQGYLDEDGHTDTKLMTEGAEELGLESAELDMNKDNLIAALDEGNVIICEVNSGDFTKDKSFIVIKEFRNGLFYVNDPSSKARSEVGWDYKRLSSQITTMWSIKRGSASISTGDDADNTDTSTGNTDDGSADVSTDGNTDDGADNGGNDNGGGEGAE